MNEHLTTDTLIDYLHHGLPPQADAAVHRHLAACAQCKSAYDAEAALSEALRMHARDTDREFPSGVRARVLDEIARASAPSVTFMDALREWLRPAVAIPAAAVLAAAFLLAVPFNGQNQTPSIDAAYYINDHAEMNGTMPFADATAAVPASLTYSNEAAENPSVAVLPAVRTAEYVR
jgi:anti-sigma factor (TIGR02949 family)